MDRQQKRLSTPTKIKKTRPKPRSNKGEAK
jgi:hypothetical protein